ncbi:MAG: tRNA (N6-threonylcarbamoyladenosine(37)-N6)-methyltransferase TrmO [Desulfobacterales bacterium]
MDEFVYKSIGVIRSSFKKPEGMPIQPSGAAGVAGIVEVDPEYELGLKDLDGFSHIILIYHFHKSEGFSLRVVPFLDNEQRGIFATRAPRRPNTIGLSIVRLKKVRGNILEIENVDVLDQTPLLDIKPFVPDFDVYKNVKTGWLAKASKSADQKKSDKRFIS